MPVHGEKFQPFVTACLAPFTGVEHQLTFINYKQDHTFFDTLTLKVVPRELHKIFRSYLIIALIVKQISSFRRDPVQVDIEVADNRTTSTEKMIQSFCYMQAFAGSGSTAI